MKYTTEAKTLMQVKRGMAFVCIGHFKFLGKPHSATDADECGRVASAMEDVLTAFVNAPPELQQRLMQFVSI